jgi:phthiocerol/phenolphthiocerol synthesis type-I polyketide synthase E
MSASTPFSDPAAAVEQRILQMWKVALGVADIGENDDFFSLGGDSMMIMTILSRVSQEFGVELSQAVLFEFPTLLQFTEAVKDSLPAT